MLRESHAVGWALQLAEHSFGARRSSFGFYFLGGTGPISLGAASSTLSCSCLNVKLDSFRVYEAGVFEQSGTLLALDATF